ncbi:rabenosyn-5-like [Artemia franciscana]|uniref:FYVE-type domain-containing protein n=1 Tax=Artemia franciscana TaxID=6661 RepID=A0AA88HVP4_ARTSF|nr:hypothetical protein QYM36_006965 [Artemia franciscana]
MSHENVEIIEGFLCPICYEDLGTILGLHSHFNDKHGEEKDILSAFKGIIGKAKTIFNEGLLNDSSLLGKKDEFKEVRVIQEQKAGVSRSFTAEFKALREAKVSYKVTKTNQLLVRLDKLVSGLPLEPSKRKAHEQNVVQWVTDEDVKMCPECAKSFGILRRRHHCRLCGSIQCHECSTFILVSHARKLIYRSQESPEMNRRVSEFSVKNSIKFKLPSSSASMASITSFADVETGEPHIRSCKYCIEMLNKYENQLEARTNRPALVVLYDSLISNKEKTTQLLFEYIDLSKLLWEGEQEFLLNDAKKVRMDLMKLADTLDGLSKRIVLLGKDQESEIPRIQLSLQNKIRYATAQFLKENLLGLPSLPSEEEMVRIREKRKAEAERRLEELRGKSPQKISHKESRLSEESPKRANNNRVYHELGWTASAAKAREDLDGTDHPMVEQMYILRTYIREAREQNRMDEVATLERNLEELEAEYSKL